MFFIIGGAGGNQHYVILRERSDRRIWEWVTLNHTRL